MAKVKYAEVPLPAFASFLQLIVNRLRGQIYLVLVAWLGLTLAVGLVTSIPMYSEWAGYKALLRNLEQSNEDSNIPPFSLIYGYQGSSGPSMTWNDYHKADQQIGSVQQLGLSLPVLKQVKYAATERMRVFSSDGKVEITGQRFAFVTDLYPNITLVAGSLPKPWSGRGPVDVLITQYASDTYTMLVGDLYWLSTTTPSGQVNIPIRIAGVWRPSNPASDFWFYPPEAFNSMVLVPEESFEAALRNYPLISYATWYFAFDHAGIRSSRSQQIINSLNEATERIRRALPGAEIVKSPEQALMQQKRQVSILSITLLLFSLPLVALVLYFIWQMAGMLIQRQQQEIAVLRSRGISRLQMVFLSIGDAIFLGVAAVIVGVPLGLVIAQVMAWTRSFLDFDRLPDVPVQMLGESWYHGALVAAWVIPALMFPAMGASRWTIVSYKQERARAEKPPFWKRAYLDILLLIPALYGTYLLRSQGLIGVPGLTEAANDPFRNPLIILAPSLLVFSLALLALRLLPIVLRIMAWVSKYTRGVAVIIMNYLSRSTYSYTPPILMMLLTISLAIFTASIAKTMDSYSSLSARYSTGADLKLVYTCAGPNQVGGSSQFPGQSQSDCAPTDYVYLPVDDYLKIRGVQAVTRVAKSDTLVDLPGGDTFRATFMGVDRITLAGVIDRAWRDDYAGESLGGLLNRLAYNPSAVIVSRDIAQQEGLRVGDRITLTMDDLGTSVKVPAIVVGTTKYFPTLYPQDGPFVIGNLDYSFDQQGSPYPFEIWMKLGPNPDMNGIVAAAFDAGLVVSKESPRSIISSEQSTPSRQGLFGVLSIGFIAAGLVTTAGLLMYTLASFRRRAVEISILRAIGLGSGRVATLLTLEQLLVVGIGAVGGTILGIAASELFIPLLQIKTGRYSGTPPFIVELAWDRVVLVDLVVAILLLVTIAVTYVFMRRMKIFEAVKLGETV